MSAGEPGAPSQPNPDAWLSEHGDALYRYALLHAGDASVAEDLVQDTLVAALQGYARFAGRSSERTWLIGILKRKVVDHIRQSTRHGAEVDLNASSSFVSEHFNAKGLWQGKVPKWGRHPEKAFEEQEFWNVLARCLSLLPPRLRFAFVGREMDDLESDEICKLLGVTATNLWTILHRARSRLRKCLEGNWFAPKAQ